MGLDCRYDVFHDKILVKGHESTMDGDTVANFENIALKVRDTVLERYGFDPGTCYTFDALKLRCLEHTFDPVRDYLEGLEWDGVERLGDWLVTYCGAEDTALNRAFGRKVLIAAVRRVRQPGCKFDYILMLEGAQGIGKSTLLMILAGGPENFSDAEIIGLQAKEQQELVQGIWIFEIAEGVGLKSEVTKIKLFASKQIDMARPAYGRSRVDRPRRCIFVGTTNEETYLHDTTGNRRFWPVKLVGKIDLAGVARDRDQLWAEAAAAEAAGEELVIPEELWADAAVQQIARMQDNPWEDAIAARLATIEKNGGEGGANGWFDLAADGEGRDQWRVSSDYLLTVVLGLAKERQTTAHARHLAGIMRKLGWTRPEGPIRIGVGGDPCRGFVKAVTPVAESLPLEPDRASEVKPKAQPTLTLVAEGASVTPAQGRKWLLKRF